LVRLANAVRARTAEDPPAFVALLHGTIDQAQAHQLDSNVERINYDVRADSLTVNSLGGNDYFASDDVTVPATLDGGAGNDTFQIGQLFGSARLPNDVLVEDGFDTTLTTRGYLSRGISAAMTVRGGNDTSVV